MSNETGRNFTPEGWEGSLELLIEVYTPTAAVIGIVFNLYCLLVMARFYHRLNFVPHLFGIILSSLSFLVVLAIYIVCVEFDLPISKSFCQFSIYTMASTQHLPGICLTAIAMERYITIFHGSLASYQSDRFRDVAVVLLIGVVCFGCQSYTIFLAESITSGGKQGCYVVASNETSVTSETANILLLLSLLLLYFVPSTLAAATNFCLVARLYWHFRLSRTKSTRCDYSNGTTGSFVLHSSGHPASDIESQHQRHLNPKLLHRINKGKRRTLVSFVILMMVDLSLHFPSCFLNITARYLPHIQPEGFGLIVLVATSHILWHLQYVMNPLAILIPVFHKKSLEYPAWRMLLDPLLRKPPDNYLAGTARFRKFGYVLKMRFTDKLDVSPSSREGFNSRRSKRIADLAHQSREQAVPLMDMQ